MRGCQAALTQDLHGNDLGEGGFVAHWIDMLDEVREPIAAEHGTKGRIAERAMELAAVKVSLENLRTFPYVEAKETAGDLKLRGAYFAISDGVLHLLDESSGNLRRHSKLLSSGAARHWLRMADKDLKNIALLIDADNTTPKGIDPVLTVMAELGRVNIKRAYGNFAKNNLSKWGEITHEYGIQPQQQFDLTAGKNATDMAMTIDAIDLLYQGKVDGFGIMSSDSDFTPLVAAAAGWARRLRLRRHQENSRRLQECLHALHRHRCADQGRLGRGGCAKTNGAKGKAGIDDELVELLGTAWKAAHRDDDGFAQMGEVGQIAGNRSSFDVRNYGFKRLSDLFEAIEQFKIERRDNTMWVKRLR